MAEIEINRLREVLSRTVGTPPASVQVIGPEHRVIWMATSGDQDNIKDLAHNLVKQIKPDL
jgi:hypothetical protein